MCLWDQLAFISAGGSHCADMSYPSARWDTASVISAHDKVHKFLRQALYETPTGAPAL